MNTMNNKDKSKNEGEKYLEEIEELLQNKLASYLNTLDDYEKVRKLVSEQFKNAFVNLAKAKYDSKIFYGQDQYDDRVKAQRIILIQENKYVLSAKESNNLKKENIKSEENDKIEKNDKTDDVDEKVEMKNKKKKTINDPIRMFSAFAPQSLRVSQEFFTQGLNDSVRLTNIIKELSSLENEIISLRKQINSK